MTQFKSYLQDIQGRLTHPQASAIYEDKINENVKLAPKGKGSKAAKALYSEDVEVDVEEIVTEYLSSFFGGEINEDVSDDDIIGAVSVLNEMCNTLNDFLLTEDEEEPDDEVIECIDALFDGELTEDTSGEQVLEAINELNMVAEAIEYYFSQSN